MSMAPELLILIATGLLLFILGYLIKAKQWSWLIAGYNTSSEEEKAKYDTVALCNGVGKFMYLLGLIVFVASFGHLLELRWIASMAWGLFGLTVIAFLVYANTGGRYRR